MANSQLVDTQYKLPPKVLNYIKTALYSNQQGDGVRRAKFLLKNGFVTYQVLKRLKNFFDHFNIETNTEAQYALAGGDLMKNFVNQTLNSNRDMVNRGVDTKRDVTQKLTQDTNTYQPLRNIRESKEQKVENALAIIFNNDNKILLLKRANIKNGWGNNQYGLVGGKIEKGETPEEACKREIKEETGVDIDSLVGAFMIDRNQDGIEHIFIGNHDDDSFEIELNDEHTNYGWFDINEIQFLDTVPNLSEYLTVAITDYK